VHQIVVDSINRTDLDLRKDLYANIVLSGGSTLTKGFGDRLLSEVQRVAVKDMRIKIFAPPERKYSTWIGGSILAGLSTFRKVGLLVCWFCGMLLTCYQTRCGLASTTGMRTPTLSTPSLPKGCQSGNSGQHDTNGPAASSYGRETTLQSRRFNKTTRPGNAVAYGMERCTMMCGNVSRQTWIVMCGARADDVERDGTVSGSVNGGIGS
jgi:hypothetical protein